MTTESQDPFTHIKPLLNDAFDRFEARLEGDDIPTGIPTGFTDLDELTVGMQPSDLYVLAARPSMG